METAVRCGFHDCKSHIKSELPAEQAKRDLVSLQLASSMKKARQGWRYFICETCGQAWAETTRDYKSPSIETCSNCGDDVTPNGACADETIKVDEYGNLIESQKQMIEELG
jgi:hypothetical protein